MGSIFIAISPHYWGRGSTIEEAKRNLKTAGGTLVRYIVYQLPPGAEDAYVDQLGYTRWTWADGADTSAEPEVVARRGLKDPP